jgi:riboflavin kinase/FMN adenylyltransferase
MRVFRTLPAVASSPVALTIGNFDGVHIGHQAMLARLTEAAHQLGLPPCVMTFEPHPREFFAPDQAPTRLTSLREKLELLERFGVERAYVRRFNFEFAKTAPEEFIERILHRGLDARWILVGDDFRFGARRGGDLAMLKQASARCGFEVHAMTSVMADGVRVSSTAVREALQAGDMRRAQRLLGRPYSISGRVVHGDGIGRKLGFPTANVLMKHNRPALAGIFAVEVHGLGAQAFAGRGQPRGAPYGYQYSAALPGGHLLDFARDLYGAHLQIDFLHKLRDEEKYADVETLKRAIANDVANTREYFAALARNTRAQNG